MKKASIFYLSVFIFLMLLLLFLRSISFEMKNKHYERMFHAAMRTVAERRPLNLREAEKEWSKINRKYHHQSEIKYYQAYPLILRVKTQYEDHFIFEKTLIEEVKYGES